MDFWTRLKNRIKTQSTTQEWISGQIEVPFGTFRKWMSNKTFPDAREGVLIAELLNTTVEYLVTGKLPEGIPPEILDIARKISSLSPQDREEILALITIKQARNALKPPENHAGTV
jgi:hypothetical protein